MESSWQVKCGSTLRSPLPPVASSTSQQLRNQMDFNSSHQHRPHVGHDIGDQRSAKLPDSMFPNVPNLSSFNSNHGNLGNSYMALLSAPASFSQSNFQDFSCPKPISASCYLVADANSTAVRATGSLVPTMPGGLLSENGGYQNLGNNPDLYPLASSRALSSSSAGRISKHYGLQVSDFHHHGTDLAKAAIIHRSLPANEKARDLPFLTEEWRDTNSANALKLQYRETQMPKKITLGADSHVLNTSTFTAWCPRVVCAGTSGDLLLSNTGLLGILCSCHGFHMSVSKFCEHSGLRNVNPGDAVRVDDEGTIAQWRKQYFQKFGIRVPEDQIGWDWPEGLSLTASLAKPNISASMSRNSDCNNMAAASGSLVRFRQPVKEAILLKNHTADQNSIIGALHNQKHRNNQDHDKILDMVCSLSSNSLAVAYDSTPNGPLPNRSTKPMFAGRGHEDDCQSTYSHFDDTLRAKNFPITSLAADNLRSGHKSSGVSERKNGKDVITVDKDAASSIELRLGQPNQLTQSSKTPILLPDGPWLYNTVATSLKPLPQEQMHCVSSCWRGKEPRQYLPFTAGISNSSRLQDQLSYRNCAISNASKQEVGGKMAIPSVASPLNYFSSPPEGLSCPKVCSNISNFKERIFPGIKVQCQSPSIKSNPTNATWDSGYNLEKQWTVSELGLSGSIAKGKVVRCLSGGNSLDETGSGSKMHNTLTEDPYSFTGVAGVNNNTVYPTIHDRDLFSHHLSNIPMDAPDAGNNSSHLEKVFLGRSSYPETDHVHFSSFGSPMGSGKLLPSKSVPIGSHSSASTSIPVLNTSLLNQENGGLNHYFADDNLRLLALRQILELSQPPLLSSIEKNIEQELHNDFSGTQMQHSLIELSASGEKRHGPKLASEQHLSEVVMKQFQPGSAGSNIWCNSTTCTQVIPLCSKDIDMQSQLSRDSLRTATPSLRFANKTAISCSNDGERCCQIMQYLKGKCSCPACKQSSGSQCELGGENASRSFREPVGVAGCKPLLFTSQFVKDCISPSETSTSHDQCKKLKGQLNFSCCGSQWRDVPKKDEGACEAACKKQSGKLVVGRGHELSSTAENIAAQGSNGAVKIEDFFKEQDISNVSSGCSTPDVNARISTELNDPDSSTVIAGNSECEKNLVVDEGSGIDKCWSSDDASGSDRSAGFYGSTSDTSLRKDDQFKVTNSSSRSLLEEVKLINSLTWKRGRSQISSEIIAHEKSFHSEGLDRDRKAWKRKREMKPNMMETSLDSAGPAACNEYPKCDGTTEKPGLSKDVESVLSSKGTAAISTVHSTKPSSRQTKSTLPLDKPVSRKRDLHRIYNAKDKGKNVSDSAIPDDSIRKKARSGTSRCWKLFQANQPICAVYGKTVDYGSASCKKESQSQQVNGCCRKKKPVVCGKYGEISSGEKAGNLPKLAKIVSLERVLKRTEKCAISKTFKPVPILQKEMNRKKSCSNDPFSEKFSNLKENKNNGGLKERDNYIHGEKQSTGEALILEKGKDEGIGKDAGSIDTNAHTNPKPKYKETRRRSLYELTLKGSNYSSELHSQKKIIKCSPKIEDEKVRSNSEDSQCYIPGSENVNVEKYTQEQKHQPTINPEALCCVCGSSKEDEINCFVECGRCLIKVHQACYGIYRVPKSTWYCRPCQTRSKDIVCVLCGYGGGAMTRALRSHAIVKSLLKAWSFKMECRPKVMLYSAESLRDKLNALNSSGSVCKHNSYPVSRPVDIEQSSTTACNMDMRNELNFVQNSLGSASTPKVHNSITAGVLDPTTKQWVHMVCGLWTPGTRCPNVNTMSAFDVSGASSPRTCMVCSICNRPGGTCIQCRVASCSVQFHPWCAHQKGLLQSEVEGLNNENVGFYGRCLIHAMGSTSKNETSPPVTKAESCARTEGYKGRKRDGFWHNLHGQSQGNGGSLVPQEQLNAWVHINGQKSFVQGLPKLPLSDMEYDCRKEYARYKQSKGWKHLVVYKSDIHALGLYTSRFISRGEMVVEYVGEIVGLRVADKRENQYQSGRKLQYKSACYFFRIDKEHIIDATRKGGIARFVNHSCLPNCVAKVISVRNEKKVVFFAERDIYPGEEVTYDYHFNNEDEGKKIPCFCNSKNCRRYLN